MGMLHSRNKRVDVVIGAQRVRNERSAGVGGGIWAESLQNFGKPCYNSFRFIPSFPLTLTRYSYA